MAKTSVRRFSMNVAWSDEDHEYVATVDEFPSLSWLAPSAEKAKSGMRVLLQSVLSDMQASGEHVPSALPAHAN